MDRTRSGPPRSKVSSEVTCVQLAPIRRTPCHRVRRPGPGMTSLLKWWAPFIEMIGPDLDTGAAQIDGTGSTWRRCAGSTGSVEPSR